VIGLAIRDCLYVLNGFGVLRVFFVVLLVLFFVSLFFFIFLLFGLGLSGFGCSLLPAGEAAALQFILEVLRFELAEVGEGDLQAVEESGGGLLVDELVQERLHDLVKGELESGIVLDQGKDEVAVAPDGRVVEAAVEASATGRGAAGQPAGADMLAAGSEIGVYSSVKGHWGSPPFG
jgi:hypothetical protein